VFAQNIPAFCELHFGIPMAGAVICALNSRLDAGMASVLLQHSEAKVVFVDAVLLGVAREALRFISQQAGGASRVPAVVLINGALDEPPPAATGNNKIPGVDRCYEYEALLSNSRGGDPEFLIRWPDDENEPIALDLRAGAVNRGEGRWICGR
jgi:acyl-CoA synthetase (AMP-forming)/AMP-acid ligase II